MPDRFAQLKKENQKVRKKVVAEVRKEEKVAEKADKLATKENGPAVANGPVHSGADEAETRRTTRTDPRKKGPEPPSTFLKASNALLARDESDDDDGAAAAAEDKGSGAKALQPKKESNTARKQAKAQRHAAELRLLATEQREQLKQRILQRLLHILMVGFVLEAWRARKQEARPKKKAPTSNGRHGADEGGWFANFSLSNLFGGPFIIVMFAAMIFGARFAEEGYMPDRERDEGMNYYEVMGVPTDADTMSIRKAYKSLALAWHPDKNPDCEACPTRFALISKAYDALSNPEKRKAYDNKRAPKDSLDSMISVELTAENFEATVLRSNSIWFVQVYNPIGDYMSSAFHPLWEDVAQSHQHIARFGRIDATKHRRALDFLPQRVVMTPIVFRFARGHATQTMLWTGGSEERGSGPVARFVNDDYPMMHRFEAADEIQKWWSSGRPRVLIAGPIATPRRGAKKSSFMQLQRVAFEWAEFFDFASAESKLLTTAVSDEVARGKPDQWALTCRSLGGGVQTKVITDLKEVPAKLQEMLSQSISHHAPAVTMRNYHQLCGSEQSSSRKYCLMLVNAAEDGAAVAGALDELNTSRATYAKEVQENEGTADEEGEATEGKEEAFHIQPLRIMTSTSRLPWLPAAAGPAFQTVWNEANRTQAFLLEYETRRIAAVRSSSLSELYQQIAYEDLRFHELPEDISLARAFPDPEAKLSRELRRVLTTFLGALVAFVFVAVAGAVLPELSLVSCIASLASIPVVLLLVWPLATRRCILPFWCMISSSSFECSL